MDFSTIEQVPGGFKMKGLRKVFKMSEIVHEFNAMVDAYQYLESEVLALTAELEESEKCLKILSKLVDASQDKKMQELKKFAKQVKNESKKR